MPSFQDTAKVFHVLYSDSLEVNRTRDRKESIPERPKYSKLGIVQKKRNVGNTNEKQDCRMAKKYLFAVHHANEYLINKTLRAISIFLLCASVSRW